MKRSFKSRSPFARYLKKRYRKRVDEERRMQHLIGNHTERSMLYNLDRLLDYSGISRIYDGISAELFIGMELLLLAGTGTLVYLLTLNILITLFSGIALLVFSYIILYLLSGRYYVKLENEIMTFLNLIENFSKTETDIIQIFKKTVFYLNDPLSYVLSEFCNEAESTGDIHSAFDNLIAKIEHKKCREIFRNLSVCSKYEANYDTIVKDVRTSMIDYLAVKSERKAILNNGRAEIVILIVSSLGIIFLFSGITDNMFGLLFDTFVGNIILFYCFLVLLICMIIMIKFDKRG